MRQNQSRPFRAPRRAEPPTHSALRAGPRDRQGSEYRALPVTRLIKTGGRAGAVVGVAESMGSELSFGAASGTSTAPAPPPSPSSLPSELNLGAGEARYSELCQHRGPARSAEWVGGCLRPARSAEWVGGCLRPAPPAKWSDNQLPPPSQRANLTTPPQPPTKTQGGAPKGAPPRLRDPYSRASTHGQTSYSSPSDKLELSGAENPLSRPHICAFTVVPTTDNSGTGVPPRLPRAKLFMSIPYTPLQSFAGSGLPPESKPGVRRTGAATHRNPPWNGVEAGPPIEYRHNPGFALRTFSAYTKKPLGAVALAVPV